VSVKAPVEFIYEPVKVGWKNGRIFVEVHSDVYHKISDFDEYGVNKIRSLGLNERVNSGLLLKVLEEKQGIPVDVTKD
jgi:L,D-transpeptidase ErfK/SrfK